MYRVGFVLNHSIYLQFENIIEANKSIQIKSREQAKNIMT